MVGLDHHWNLLGVSHYNKYILRDINKKGFLGDGIIVASLVNFSNGL